jgi:hypothetical protein
MYIKKIKLKYFFKNYILALIINNHQLQNDINPILPH